MLRIACTEYVRKEEVLRNIETTKKSLIIFRKKAEIFWTYDKEGKLGEFNIHMATKTKTSGKG